MTNSQDGHTPFTAVIDRRLNGKNKSLGNRERFNRRYKEAIRDAVRQEIGNTTIKDFGTKDSIEGRVKKKDIREPVFQHASSGGDREYIHPGNKEYIKGDKIERSKGGGGSGSGNQAGDGEGGEDDFVWKVAREEYMRIFFDDLALPNLVRSQLTETPEYKSHRAGISGDGNPTDLHVVKSMTWALARKIVFNGPKKERRLLLTSLTAKFEELCNQLGDEEIIQDVPLYKQTEQKWSDLYNEIIALNATVKNERKTPFIDPVDLRYRNRVQHPVPSAKAAMFCLMDVSGSMDEARKDMSKRFFMLLYMFLTRHYEKIDLIFIRHHTTAEEVSEDEFFHATATGGTMASSALTLMHDIIKKRYASGNVNIYGAQASDGDNWPQDSQKCKEMLKNHLLPLVRYFAYIQVAEARQNMWEEYESLAADKSIGGRFAIKKVKQASEIYDVFRELFKKDGAPLSSMTLSL